MPHSLPTRRSADLRTLLVTEPKANREAEDTDQVGDLAESWEISPDKLQITFKLRPGPKWDARPPTNGRAVDASDVAYSWQEWSARSRDRKSTRLNSSH